MMAPVLLRAMELVALLLFIRLAVLASGDDVTASSGQFDGGDGDDGSNPRRRVAETTPPSKRPASSKRPARAKRRTERSPNPTDHYFCGKGFEDASSCEHPPCPSGSLEDCPSGMLCYYDVLLCDARDLPSPPSASPTEKKLQPAIQESWSENDPRLSYFCGEGWQHASDTCGVWCPDADDEICPYGQFCFRNTECKAEIPRLGPWSPPTQSPLADDDPRLRNFCGTSWQGASESCLDWCPDGEDDNCPYGQSCFSDTPCKYTPSPSDAPTPRPTGPSQSPTPAPQPLLPDDPANNMFCAVDWEQAGKLCSIEKHCGENGDAGCLSHEFCWHDVECDIREFIPFEDGGWLGKPTHQEMAEALGLSWPSDDPTDHYFCGATFRDASEHCRQPCPDALPLTCDVGEYCFEGTECDRRVTPGYGITQPPTLRPTFRYSSKENYNFCGVNWLQANSCKMQWCGDGSKCPNGQSCYADTECNIQDRVPMPPSRHPTHSPVPYDHKSNNFFCGATYADAVENCNTTTYCRSGQHDECESGLFCWAGVACNIQDFLAPSPYRSAAPTIDSPRPTYERDDPRNTRFCGENWRDASASCKDGNRARWCPNGSNEECLGEETCWADTMCNMLDFTNEPSYPPTGAPTVPPPTVAPVGFDDPIYTSFCGETFAAAEGNCDISTYCPSGLQTECPTGQYCWTVKDPSCNYHYLIGPTPPPTLLPTQSPATRFMPSEAPSRPATEDPTEKPTLSPLEESDERRFFFCGTSYADASYRCDVRCPEMTGCPEGQYCFGNTGCGAAEPTTTPTMSPKTPQPTQQLTDETASPPTHIPFIAMQNPPSISPTMSRKTSVSLPYSTLALPKPPTANTQRMLHIVESVQYSLAREIFVIDIQSGSQLPSSLYSYDGFHESLQFFSTVGVKGQYLYLGQEHTQSATTENVEIECAIANVALFLAKMMDTIAVERCDPNLIACGLHPLDDTFQEHSLRVECSPLSPDAGMECPNASGCVCILGVLNHYIGAQSGLTSGEYASIDFCERDLLQSICSRRLAQGEELRWITSMSYWVLFVQQYDDGNLSYISGLKDFVRGGMIDTAFLDAVASLSVWDAEVKHQFGSAQQTGGSSTFIPNFFKTIIKLSEGASYPMPNPQPEVTTMPPTISPSEKTVSVDTPAPVTAYPVDISDSPTGKPVTQTNSLTSGAGVAGGVPPSSNDHSSLPPASAAGAAATAGDFEWPALLSYKSVSPSVANYGGTATPSSKHPTDAPSDSASSPPTNRRHWDYDVPWYQGYFSSTNGVQGDASRCKLMSRVVSMTCAFLLLH